MITLLPELCKPRWLAQRQNRHADAKPKAAVSAASLADGQVVLLEDKVHGQLSQDALTA